MKIEMKMHENEERAREREEEKTYLLFQMQTHIYNQNKHILQDICALSISGVCVCVFVCVLFHYQWILLLRRTLSWWYSANTIFNICELIRISNEISWKKSENNCDCDIFWLGRCLEHKCNFYTIGYNNKTI